MAELPQPELEAEDEVLVQILSVGVCGTDREVMAHGDRWGLELPNGDDFLVMGHEAVGRVLEIGPGVRSLAVGDLVVPTWPT